MYVQTHLFISPLNDHQLEGWHQKMKITAGIYVDNKNKECHSGTHGSWCAEWGRGGDMFVEYGWAMLAAVSVSKQAKVLVCNHQQQSATITATAAIAGLLLRSPWATIVMEQQAISRQVFYNVLHSMIQNQNCLHGNTYTVVASSKYTCKSCKAKRHTTHHTTLS